MGTIASFVISSFVLGTRDQEFDEWRISLLAANLACLHLELLEKLSSGKLCRVLCSLLPLRGNDRNQRSWASRHVCSVTGEKICKSVAELAIEYEIEV